MQTNASTNRVRVEGSIAKNLRRIAALVLVSGCFYTTGCSLCAPGYLCDYAGVGGKWQRTDPEHGRVGSILSDPNSVVSASATSDSAVVSEAYNYGEGVGIGESIVEPEVVTPAETSEGVIILGD